MRRDDTLLPHVTSTLLLTSRRQLSWPQNDTSGQARCHEINISTPYNMRIVLPCFRGRLGFQTQGPITFLEPTTLAEPTKPLSESDSEGKDRCADDSQNDAWPPCRSTTLCARLRNLDPVYFRRVPKTTRLHVVIQYRPSAFPQPAAVNKQPGSLGSSNPECRTRRNCASERRFRRPEHDFTHTKERAEREPLAGYVPEALGQQTLHHTCRRVPQRTLLTYSRDRWWRLCPGSEAFCLGVSLA